MQTNFYKNKKSLLKLLLVLTLISYTLFFSFQKNIISGDSNINFPNTNDGEITIITPENITYTEPMSGYYPATYGFENDLIGTNPQNWGTNEDSSTSIQVEEVFNDHKNVLSFIDQSSGGNCESWRDVGAQTSGYVEYWVAVEDVATLKMVTLTLRDGGVYGTVVFGLTIRTDYIQPWGSASHICDLVAEQWVHIKLKFNCSSDQGDIYVNGVYNNTFPFVNNVDDIDCLRIETSWGDFSAEKVYFDAFGASWDSNYNVGDNLIEGLLLSYDTTTTLDWQGYSLDGTANKTILGNTTIPMPDEGVHNIQVFGNDSLGTMYESDIRYFSVDILSPIITINFPLQNKHYGSEAPNFDVSITEPNLNTTWYTIDSGLTNITFTGFTGTIDQTEWDDQVDGQVTIRFYANDTFGHINYAEVLVGKDTTLPSIIINSPNVDDYYSSEAPNFDVSITEPNLNITWYTIDSGLTNVTFTGFTGTIDQTEWDDQVDGQVTIRFYANDTFGHINYAEVLINKDTLDPVITINSPLTGEIFTALPPQFNLTIDEVNLDTTWYTLDGGATTINFTELTGYIDSTAWNNAPIGAVTIRFYARDKGGNEIYQEVIVIKSSSQQEIPGFNIALLCLTIVIITTSLLKIKKYKIK